MNVIVLSKDRAAQLDLFIRGFIKHFDVDCTLKVLYHYSNDDFERGYGVITERYSGRNIIFHDETSFKTDLLYLVDPMDSYTVFFVDDIIFKEDFSDKSTTFREFRMSQDTACLSLRLHPVMNYCYAASHPMKPVNTRKIYWPSQTGDYAYPMSLDGHIFRTVDILPLLKNLSYKNPNSLEAALACNPIMKPFMMCFNESIVVNNPCNKVQTNNPNKHGDIDAAYLNEQFLSGKIIDASPYDGQHYNACHVELPVSLVDFLPV